MIYYELKIESGDNVIEIAEAHTIYFAKVFLDTTSENTKTKSNAMLARVIIKGDIKPSINDKLIAISEWARDLIDETTYRKVILTIKIDSRTPFRTYEIPDMFVYNYREEYGDPIDNKTAIFELELRQKETKLDEFNTY